MQSHVRSRALMERARMALPGGVNSPVRAFASVGLDAPVITRGFGSTMVDEDGNQYLDFIMGYGAHILGHTPEPITRMLAANEAESFSFGCTTVPEIELAERIIAAFPSIEMVRFMNSGTEATMSAVRLARAATGRSVIVKCDGGYHGHADALLVNAGSGVATLGIAGSPGIPAHATADTRVVPFNDVSAMEELFQREGTHIAAIIVEPVAGNIGTVPPAAHYLASLRSVADAYGALLIFDEVMTGFRVSFGGAQTLYGVTPDITCLGKIIGGGFPIGCVGGSGELMHMFAPTGPVYQAGTMSGHRLAMLAGCAVLDTLQSGMVYRTIESLGERLQFGMRAVATEAGLDCSIQRVGGMLSIFFDSPPVENYAQAKLASRDRFSGFYGSMYERGILWPPSPFETAFLSAAHTDADIDRVIVAFAMWASARADETTTPLGSME